MRKSSGLEARAITLQDVAEKAGVGLSTASYVLNNKPKSIGVETRERVFRAARDLGYRPNMAARSLVTKQTNIIALWIPNVTSAFAGRIIGEIQKQARRDGYEVMICDTEPSVPEPAPETEGHKTAAPPSTMQMPLWNVDGLIAFFGSSSGSIERDFPGGPPIPTVSMGTFSIPDTDFTELCLFAPTLEAVKWLLAQGRKKVGFLVPTAADFEGDERHEAYLAAIGESKQEPLFIYIKENSRKAAYEATRDYLRENSPVDALFCYNDYVAIGASRAIREAGLSIPDQVLIVGCDGIEDGDYLEWPLHTIELPIAEMCASAWQSLRDRLSEPNRAPQKNQFTGHLIIKK